MVGVSLEEIEGGERERDIFAGKFEMSVVYKDLLIRERFRSFDLRIKTALEVGKYIIYN